LKKETVERNLCREFLWKKATDLSQDHRMSDEIRNKWLEYRPQAAKKALNRKLEGVN
jgi:hypothetical protein